MISRENKIRIFAEYLFCTAINGEEEFTINLHNIEKLVDDGFKIKLKSVYDLTTDDMFEIAEEMRYSRCLTESFREFDKKYFTMSNQSRNHRNLQTAMISYVAKTDDGLKGNWFTLIGSIGIGNLRAKHYDVGSSWCFVKKGEFIDRLSLEEGGLAVIL